MMISDTLNWHDYDGFTEITAPSSNVYSADEDESKRIIVHKTLLQNCSAGESELKIIIVHKTLLHNYSADVGELCSTEIDISEYTITRKKDAEYEESSVTKEMPIYFNIFECGGNILDIIDVTYERACMATPKDKYYTKLLKTLVDDNNRNGSPLSNENIKILFSIVMKETEAEIEHDIKEIKMDNSFQSPVQKKYISTINNSGYN